MKQRLGRLTAMLRTHQFRILVLLFAFALFVRLIFLVPLTVTQAVESGNDAQGYFKRAIGFEQVLNSLANGKLPSLSELSQAYTSAWPPAQSFLLSLGFLVLGPNLFAGRVTMILISALTTPFVYLVTEKLSSRRVALLAALILALYPGFIHFSVRLFSETTFILVLFVALLFALLTMEAKSTRRAAAFAIATGFFLGFQVLVRAITIVWIPVFVLWMGLRFPQRGSRVLISALVLASTLITLFPWEAALFVIEGRVIVITQTGDLSMYVGDKLNLPNNPRLAVASVTTSETNPQDMPLKEISNPRLELPKPVREWSRTWNPDFTLFRYLFMLGFPPLNDALVLAIMLGVSITFCLFMLLALWGLLNPQPALRHRSLIVGLIAITMVTYLFTHGQSRYSMPFLALLLPAAGHGLEHAKMLFARSNRAWSLSWLASVAVLGVTMYVGLPYEYGTVAPSSYYANLVRTLDPILGNNMLVSDRLVLRSADADDPPKSVTLSIVGNEFQFVDTAIQTIEWRTETLPLLTVAAQSRTATQPLQLQITTSDREKPTLVTLKPEAWHTWEPIGHTGIEYMWIGSAGFSASAALEQARSVHLSISLFR